MTDFPAALNESGADAPALPPVPRPSTPRARRRSWAEMPVRIWLVLTATILLITFYFTFTRVREALADRWLINHGLPVNARFERVAGDPVPKRRPRNEPMVCEISFTVEGKKHQFPIVLEAKPGGFARVGEDFPIRVDPGNPNRWTERTSPRPWAQELTAVGLLVPICLVLLGVTLWRRWGMLRIWQNGELAEGAVVEARHTAVAPLSRVIRFTYLDGDRRVWTTLIPTSSGVPQKGERVWLIRAPNSPGRAVMARLYE